MINFKRLKLVSWNVRGLGLLQKCYVVRDVLRASRCDIVCFQETKINKMEFNYVSRLLPSFFEYNCVFLDATESRGGS